MVSAETTGAMPYGPGRQGAFTFFLLQGLLGAADGQGASPKKDGWVNANEAFAYLRQRMQEAGYRQDPFMTRKNEMRLAKTGGAR